MSADDPNDKGHLRQETVEAIRDEVLQGIGYKQPPKRSQFQPGRSGNPKGRPRAAPPDLSLAEQPSLDAVWRMSQKPVKIREGDRISEVSMRDAVAQSIFSAALKGNARSQGLAMDLMRTAEQKHARELQEHNRIWSDYKEVMSERLAQVAARNEPPMHLLPHPDDIVINPVKGPQIFGPLDEDDEAKMKETIAFCEALIMQDVLDHRSRVSLTGEPLTEPGSAMVLFYILQQSIPTRLRLPDTKIILRWMDYEHWPKRRLLMELHQAWQKLGKPFPRGTVLPNLSATRKRLAFLFDLFAEFQSGRIDIDALGRGEPDDATLDIFDRHGIKFA